MSKKPTAAQIHIMRHAAKNGGKLPNWTTAHATQQACIRNGWAAYALGAENPNAGIMLTPAGYALAVEDIAADIAARAADIAAAVVVDMQEKHRHPVEIEIAIVRALGARWQIDGASVEVDTIAAKFAELAALLDAAARGATR